MGSMSLFYSQGDYQRAEGLIREAAEIRRQHFGPSHPLTLATLKYLGAIFVETQQYERATLLYERLVESVHGSVNRDSEDFAILQDILARLREKFGENCDLYHSWPRIRLCLHTDERSPLKEYSLNEELCPH